VRLSILGRACQTRDVIEMSNITLYGYVRMQYLAPRESPCPRILENEFPTSNTCENRPSFRKISRCLVVLGALLLVFQAMPL